MMQIDHTFVYGFERIEVQVANSKIHFPRTYKEVSGTVMVVIYA